MLRTIFFAITLLQTTLTFAIDQIHLSIGESLFLPIQSHSTIRLQRKDVVQIKDFGNKLQVVGKKLGTTSLHCGKKEYSVIILEKPLYKSLHQLEEWIKDKRGLRLDIKENSLSIQGRFLSFEDFLNLDSYTDSSSEFVIESLWSTAHQLELETFLYEKLKKNNLLPGQLTFSPYLSMRLNKEQSTKISEYKKILNPFGVSLINDQNNFGQNPTIKIQLHIAHVKKSFFRIWGVRWPSQATATLVDGKNLSLNPMEVSIHSLESQGLGKVLASPQIIAESGKEAAFHSGGEFPIRTSTQFTNNVHWKPYGLFLKTKSFASANGQLQIQIKAEISAIDKSNSAEGVPGMIRNVVETTVNMKQAQPILISGLIQKDQSNNREGLAWLSQIPLLKNIFSTGEILSNEHDLIFILIPSLI